MTTQISPEQIKTELTGIFRKVFDDPLLTLREDMTAADVEGWDSLSHITLIVSIERSFRIKVALAEIQRLNDVGALIQLIHQKVR
jgi:acyl carrier protein